MPVKAAKDKKSAELECEHCGVRAIFPSASRAAPELTACEEAATKEGWSYSIGFFAMLLGHDVLCPKCTTKESDE